MAIVNNVSDEVVLAYIDARAALYQVCCCFMDDEIETEFIVGRLKTAMQAVTYLMLEGDGYAVPPSTKDRVSMLRSIYGKSFVPKSCAMFASAAYGDSRADMIQLCQDMDTWLSLTFPRYSDLISRINQTRSLRAYAC